MRYIKPADDQKRPEFLYFLATSGSAVGVSGDGIFTVPEQVIEILDKQNLKYVDVPPPQKPVNPS
jgi:hypothetical protein